jgi:hypothetical protein
MNRYIVYVDVGVLPISKAEAHLASVKVSFTAANFWNADDKVVYLPSRTGFTTIIKLD